MSAMPEAMRIMDSGLPFAFGECGLWPPALRALRAPSKEDVVLTLFKKMERGVLEVLTSDSPEEFAERFARGIHPFHRQMMACQELLPEVSDADVQEQWAELVQQAADFGGDQWSDVVENSFRSVRWAMRIGRRMSHTGDAPLDVTVRLIRHHGALMLWSWSAFAVQVILNHPTAVSADMQGVALALMRASATEAFCSVRSIEIERQEVEDAKRVEVASGPVEIDPELRLLEEDAHQESIRLLAAIGA